MKIIIQSAMSAGVFARGRVLCPDMLRIARPFFIIYTWLKPPAIRGLP